MDNKLKELLKKDYVILDGGMGTMLQAAGMKMGETPEMLNITQPELLISIHEKYLNAGSDIIYANTFGGNRYKLEECGHSVHELVTAGIKNARTACDNVKPEALVALDVGPIGQLLEPTGTLSFEEAYEMYAEIVKAGEAAGADLVVFETMTDLLDVKAAVLAAKENSSLPVMTTMTFEENMRTFTGCQISAFALTAAGLGVDALGVNCSLGPKELEPVIAELTQWTNLPVIVKPNAGLPDPVTNLYNVNAAQFAEFMKDLRKYGIKVFGGCCGTTPDYIKNISEMIRSSHISCNINIDTDGDFNKTPVKNSAFYCGKEGKKLIAVELAPPFDSDADKLMDAAHYLKEKGVDVLTFPDSPSGRTRADSILIAAKVSRQTGMCVMPHLCCRDKNAIAIRSQLLGAHINGINNFLVITGDPIPQMIRSSVKSVFNFDSVGLMNIIEDMNEDQFKYEPVVYGGAINQGRKRLDIEISRVKKKMEAGAAFFMTQPVFSDEDIKRLSTIKKETGARILCGIMPLVSLKNATFMKNEMAGIDVTDEVLSRYSEDMTKKEGEAAGVKLAVDMINKTKDIVDGYYFSFPFNRVYMLEDILSMSQI